MNDTTSVPRPGNSSKKHRKIIIIVLSSLFFLVIAAIAGVAIWYSSINISQTMSYEHEYDTFNKRIEALLYKYKCGRQDRVYYEVGWSTLVCYRKSPDAGKECIQNSDCQAGVCVPSSMPSFTIGKVNPYEWKVPPEVNEDGFIVGKCSEVAWPFDPKHGGTCMSSYIIKPSTIDDPSGISEGAFCN